MILGHLHVEKYLKRSKGFVTGSVVTDAKNRYYRQNYSLTEINSNSLAIKRLDNNGDEVIVPKIIELNESLTGFFGLYSGDGSKGIEDPKNPGRIIANISFSQKEKNLVRFAVDQFRRLFTGNIEFIFSLGEDSAYFMAGEGKDRLEAYYRDQTGLGTPTPLPLSSVRSSLKAKDHQYLSEKRLDVPGTNQEHLSFYYQHKPAMEAILSAEKQKDLSSVGINIGPGISVTASLRRPFKKGARMPGGSSRSDEIHLRGLNGIGELFLKMMHEIEDSILQDAKISNSGLVEWVDQPSKVGANLDLYDFFKNNPYGIINNSRPKKLIPGADKIIGQWTQSRETTMFRYLRIDPLWCYMSGIYLAEGSTPKELLFSMFSTRPGAMSLGFTSSEGVSIELMLRNLQKLFPKKDCLDAWKVKVGSQYFPELVVTGLKQGVPMLRGGASGDGKLRTMEISLSIKEWALAVADAPLNGATSLLRQDYADYYSHVEPTGSGVARIDFWASSTLSRWYFPLIMHTVFSGIVVDPTKDFYK